MGMFQKRPAETRVTLFHLHDALLKIVAAAVDGVQYLAPFDAANHKSEGYLFDVVVHSCREKETR
jgi:hypothetical protein